MCIKKTRIIQKNITHNHQFNKKLKQRTYRLFLQQHTAYLPTIQTLQKWRKHLFYASILSLTPACLMTIIDLQWAESDLITLPLPITGLLSPTIIGGSLFLILLSFTAMFDHVIYKRWGQKHAFIHW